MDNSYSSYWLKLSRGICHGCFLSVYPFLLCAETITCIVRENNFIVGLMVDNT